MATLKTPCEVCGQPCSSRTGICQRTEACAREYYRRMYHMNKNPGGQVPTARTSIRAKRPCDVCGRMTVSKFGVCKVGGPGCRDEYMRRQDDSKGRSSKGRGLKRPTAVPPLDVPEEWRPVVDFEGLYEVSDKGRVKSLPRAGGRQLPEYVLKPYLSSKDPHRAYLNVHLRNAEGRAVTRKVHRLVAEAFIGPLPPGQVVRHGLGGPSDNRLENLCYGTTAQNVADIALHRQMMREAPWSLSESVVLDIHRSWLAGELPPRITDEYAAVMRHAAALLERRRASEDIARWAS